MKIKYLTIGIIFISLTYCLGQGTGVDVVFNNTADIKSFSDKIPKIKSLANPEGLMASIRANPHIKMKSLSMRIAFFDRGYVGELKLKQEHSLTAMGYVERWKEANSSNNGILFLFVKSKDATQYAFHKMDISPKLEEDYLLPLVVDFINEKLTGDVELVIANGSKYLLKALIPIWNEGKMARAESLINDNAKYKQGHTNFFHNWFTFGFFNFKPASQKETEQMKLVNCWSKVDMSDKNWYFSNKYIFTNDSYLNGFDAKKIYDWGVSFEEDKISGVYIFKDAFLYNLLTYIETTNKHNSTAIASEWNWTIDKNTSKRTISDFTGFNDRIASDKLILYFDESLNTKEGEPISKLSGSASNTWCNIFACDLANEVLFGNIFGDIHNGPWGANQCANALHYRISSDRANFKEVSLEEAWVYTLKGFVVYLTMFNKNMSTDLLNSAQKESRLCNNKSGHIATCFPEIGGTNLANTSYTQNYVVQAGSSIGKIKFGMAIGDIDRSKIKANVFLGYITK